MYICECVFFCFWEGLCMMDALSQNNLKMTNKKRNNQMQCMRVSVTPPRDSASHTNHFTVKSYCGCWADSTKLPPMVKHLALITIDHSQKLSLFTPFYMYQCWFHGASCCIFFLVKPKIVQNWSDETTFPNNQPFQFDLFEKPFHSLRFFFAFSFLLWHPS